MPQTAIDMLKEDHQKVPEAEKVLDSETLEVLGRQMQERKKELIAGLK